MTRHGVIIYPKDVQRITGRSEAYARRIIRAIKESQGKAKHQFVTDEEFCAFSGLTLRDLERALEKVG